MALIKRKDSRFWHVAIYNKEKMHWYSTKTENRLEAEKFELEMKSIAKGEVPPDRLKVFIEKISNYKPVSVGLFLSGCWPLFLRQPAAERKKRTIAEKKIYWENFVRWLNQNYPAVKYLGEVSRDMAVQFLRSKKADNVSSQTYNHYRNEVRHVIKSLMYGGGLVENPFDVTTPMPKKQISFRAFTNEELERLLSKCNPDWRLAVLIALYTGLRFKDVCFLRWDSIHFEKDLIVLIPAKTERLGKKVRIPIHAELRDILQHLPDNNSEYVIPVFAAKYGKKDFQGEFSALLKKTDIEANSEGRISFHSLRHTFVTVLEDAGVSREAAQKLVGHGSPAVTDIYSHSIELLKNAIRRLPKFRYN